MTAELAEMAWSLGRSNLSTEAVDAAVRLVQHALGVSIAGSGLTIARNARNAIGTSTGPCTVFGSAILLPAQDAAFVNAVAGHASLLEDSGPGGKQEGSHPATYVFPVVLAVAEQERSSGMDLIRAFCAAYETVSRLGAATPSEVFERGFRVVPLLGPFGAAAAAGVLMRLTREQLASSFGIAANLASGFNQGFVDGTIEPYLHPAFAARNGILAAQLAAAGCVASYRSLEGDRGFFATFAGAQPILDKAAPPQETLSVCRVGTKRFATCLYNQGTLALLRRTFPEGLSERDIDRVAITRPALGVNGLTAPGVAAPPPYTTMLQLQMSARFTAAAALIDRAIDSAAYYESALEDEAAISLAKRIELHDGSRGIQVEIVMRNGNIHRAAADEDVPLGFSSADTAAEFAARVRPVLGHATQQLAALLADLPRLENVSALTAALGRHR